MLTDFQNSFTDRFTSKFATKSLLTIPPHLNCVTTLPCKISVIKNCSAQELSVSSKLSCKSQPLKTVVKNSLQWFQHYLLHWLQDIQIGHTKIPTLWLYASAATQTKRYCSKMLLHMMIGRLVTSCLVNILAKLQPVTSPNVHRC